MRAKRVANPAEAAVAGGRRKVSSHSDQGTDPQWEVYFSSLMTLQLIIMAAFIDQAPVN
jgi:hypothetical protein